MLALPPPMLKPKRHRPRLVEPELLDALPSSDPDAVRSRRDLRLINQLMGNNRWILRQLQRLGQDLASGENWELGSGDGLLGAGAAERFGEGAFRITALDLAPRAPFWPAGWDWHQADILETAKQSPRADLVIANLVLHHFQDAGLAMIGRWISAANTVIAVEPLRARFPHALAYTMRLLDINHVTREDIHTSIRAGFRDRELPELLGLSTNDWDVRTSITPLGAYRMLARRRPPKK